MNKLEKLQEATMLALQGKLTESNIPCLLEDNIVSSKSQLADQIEEEFLHELKEDNITISSEEDLEKVAAKFISEAAINYELENDEEIIFWIDLISLDPLKIKVNIDNA